MNYMAEGDHSNRPELWIYPVGTLESERIYDIVLGKAPPQGTLEFRDYFLTHLVETWVRESELRRRYPKLPKQLTDMNIRPYMG